MDVEEFYRIEDNVFWDLRYYNYCLALSISDLMAHAYVRWYPNPFRKK